MPCTREHKARHRVESPGSGEERRPLPAYRPAIYLHANSSRGRPLSIPSGRRPSVQASVRQRLHSRENLLVARESSQASQAVASAFDVGPAHDPVSIDQKLRLQLADLPFPVAAISPGLHVALERAEGRQGLHDRQRGWQLARRIDACRAERLQCGGVDLGLRYAVRAVRRQLRIGAESQPRRPEPEVQLRVLGRGGNDPDALDTSRLELALGGADAGDLTASRLTPFDVGAGTEPGAVSDRPQRGQNAKPVDASRPQPLQCMAAAV